MECMFDCKNEATSMMVTVNESHEFVSISVCLDHIDEAARL